MPDSTTYKKEGSLIYELRNGSKVKAIPLSMAAIEVKEGMNGEVISIRYGGVSMSFGANDWKKWTEDGEPLVLGDALIDKLYEWQSTSSLSSGGEVSTLVPLGGVALKLCPDNTPQE